MIDKLELKKLEGEALPLLPLRNVVLFPHTRLTFEVSRELGKLAVTHALKGNRKVIAVCQKDPYIEEPEISEFYPIATVAELDVVVDEEDGTLRVSCLGLSRCEFSNIEQVEKPGEGTEKPFYYTAKAQLLEPFFKADINAERMRKTMRKTLSRLFKKVAPSIGELSRDVIWLIQSTEDNMQVMDIICSILDLEYTERYDLLTILDGDLRMQRLVELMHEELEIWKMGRNLSRSVEKNLEGNQRKIMIREQIKALEAELGDGGNPEIENLAKRLEDSKMKEEDKVKVRKEIDRLRRIPESFPEALVQRNWIELLLDLPFGEMNDEIIDLDSAQKVLDRDHYGLKKVKERIIEYIAVRKQKTKSGDLTVKGPILCIVGPPGVGKTSIARSVAAALGREYVRMSLGGVRDEAEIRGHRRTYVGAMPGRVIQAIRNAGCDNPLILLDEVDKLGRDFRGDPSSALLEVLDPEQNSSFRDHYVELEYDLSHVLFITTANAIETIPEPLLDRMEIIEISGYTEEEKMQIAKRHLLAKQLAANGLEKKHLSLTDGAYHSLITGHTSEAGVRQLERELAGLCRKVAVKLSRDEDFSGVRINQNNLDEYAGNPRYSFEKALKKAEVGMATGLAWTYAGGDTLTIEINHYPGSGKLLLTGRLGEVMKESAQAALSYVRSRCKELEIPEAYFSQRDVHIHLPAGAVPKDGPSAGITLATALASALSERPVRADLAMTGEITLRGRVMQIGGLKEKTVAAKRAGIKEVLIPKDNEREIKEEVPETVQNSLKITPVEHMDEVLKLALLPAEKSPQAKAVKQDSGPAEKSSK
ncbi:MAG: endopeptidase La [Eubacteriales bacterium]|nr:endopeptidase La [Eubacteriales bacterium]